MRHLKTTFAVLGAVFVLVLTGNALSVAATGSGFVLGHVNTANKQTVLKRTTPGAALKIITKSGANPPFSTNGHGKVAGLNADMIDGLDSSALTTKPYVFTKTITTPVSGFDLPVTVPPGSYLISYSTFLIASPTTTGFAVSCYVDSLTGSKHVFTAAGSDGGDAPAQVYPGGSGFLAKTAATSVTLKCSSTTTFITPEVSNLSAPVQFVLTRVNGATAAH